MIDIEILSAVLKELGYLDDSVEGSHEHQAESTVSETGEREDDILG